LAEWQVGSNVWVVDQASAAFRLAQPGASVLLVVDPDDDYVALTTTGSGHLAVMVGRLDDVGVRRAAEEMAKELFERRP
jgi:hypothetical protein